MEGEHYFPEKAPRTPYTHVSPVLQFEAAVSGLTLAVASWPAGKLTCLFTVGDSGWC